MMVTLICELCGKPFQTYPSEIKKARRKNSDVKYCSRACYEEARKPTLVIIACLVCGRNVQIYKSYLNHDDRQFCSRECMFQRAPNLNPNWGGGKFLDDDGYVLVFKRSHPYARNGRYVCEHRFVMESHLGRYLRPEEVVHHINGNKQDNRLENLKLFANESEHRKHHWKITRNTK